MAKKKRKNKLINKNNIYLLFVILFLMFFALVVIYKGAKINDNRSSMTLVKSEPTGEISKPSPVLYQKAENGIYTNYSYGIRLKYPNKIFIKAEFSDPYTVDFFTSENLSRSDRGEIEKYPNDIFFSITTVPAGDMVYKLSQEGFDRSLMYRGQVGIGNSNYDVLFKNIEIYQNKDRKILINYHGPDLYTEENIKKFKLDDQLAKAYPQVYSLNGMIMFNNMSIGLSFSSANKKLIDSNINLFEKMLNSIEVFSTHNTSKLTQ